MYLLWSRTTATLHVWPARLVPPPRDTIGTSWARQISTVRIDVVGIPRDDDADRKLAVVRGVGRIQRAAAGVEPDVAADFVQQVDHQSLDAGRRGFPERGGRSRRTASSTSAARRRDQGRPGPGSRCCRTAGSVANAVTSSPNRDRELRPACLSSRPMPGPRDPATRRRHWPGDAVEEHLLDPDVVVEPFEMDRRPGGAGERHDGGPARSATRAGC